MSHNGNWSPYAGSGSILLAIGLFIITGVLLYLAMRLHRPILFKKPGKVLGISLVVMWFLSVIAFLVAVTIYVTVLSQQVGHITAAANPITPVTMTSAVLTFFIIVFLAQKSGPWVAIGSAIVGTIAAPMIFELPFDLIVMWRTYPPAPAIPFTLLFFVPLFLVELLSFAMLTLSPLAKLSRSTLFLLAGMFLIFAVWALFGFAYPSAPIPIAFNMIAKVIAFAAVVSLFLTPEKIVQTAGQFVPASQEIGQ
jgi:hypothetical protein